MKQIDDDPYFYEVEPGEQVTFHIREHGTAPLVTMALDGEDLDEPFSFEATKPSGGRHFVATSFDFDDESTDTARYEISVSGSKTDEKFKVPRIKKTTRSKEPVFEFTVR